MDTPVPRRRSRGIRSLAATASVAALVIGASFAGATAATAAPTEGSVTGATLTWGLNDESGGGAFFGGCNFLSAGVAGNSGGQLWTESLYASTSPNVSIKKPNADGVLVSPTWETKCQTPTGAPVSAFSTTSLSKNVAVIENGTGTVAADGSTTVSWTGSFSIVYYGGLTYWTATNPVLTLDANGAGTLTATASGYGSSMEDTTKWEPIDGRTITLANFTGGTLTDAGYSATPEYRGVAITTSGSTAQSTTGPNWGSFPQDFVDFQVLTGQSSYWYSSGGSRDAAKPASPLTTTWTVSSESVTPPTAPTTPSTPAAPDEQSIEVTVPSIAAPPSGTFGWAFESTDAVSLGTATQAGSTFTASGALNPIIVTDTRAGGTGVYGWSVSGQASDFTSGSSSFGSRYLGWTPSISGAGNLVSAGTAITSSVLGGTGLSQSATLASSRSAASATIQAGLSLVIPTTVPAGNYTSTLTVTALG